MIAIADEDPDHGLFVEYGGFLLEFSLF